MKRYIVDTAISGFLVLLILAIAVFFLSGCTVEYVTVVVTATPRTVTETPESTLISTTSPTQEATSIPTLIPPTEEPTSGIETTPLPVVTGNLLLNPDFEEGWTELEYCNEDDKCGKYPSPDHWYTYFKAPPFTLGKYQAPYPCEEGQEFGCNDVGIMMNDCEFKPIYLNTAFSGSDALQFFNSFDSFTCGVLQVVEVPLVAECTLSAYVKRWLPDGFDQGRNPEISNYWEMGYDINGETYPFYDQAVRSGELFFQESVNEWEKMSWTFYPGGGKLISVFVENTQVWRWGNNDKYIDYLSLTCDAYPTPTPIVP